MSYNIDTGTVIKGQLRMTGRNIAAVFAEHGDRLPECSFIGEVAAEIGIGASASVLDAEQDIDAGNYYGVGSGHGYDLLCDTILPLTTGSADIVFTWEGGDSQTGVRVVEGKVTRHKVVTAFGGKE